MKESQQDSRILIVDDVAINIELMKSILQADRYLIASAGSGEAALLKTRTHVFDLILLDIVLPDINGFDVCRQIKQHSPNRETPVIFLTAQRDEKSLVEGFRLGAVDYILKPFSPEELRARVKSHISLKKSQEDLKKARDIAEEAVRAKALFLANMSHEIRTPLNGIIGMIDILKHTELTDQQLEYLDIVDISSETLLTIINDILDFSKLEAGQIDCEKILYDLRQETDEIYKILVYSARQKDLEFCVQVDEAIPVRLLGDPFRLRQILINLGNNAIKFTKKGFVRMRVFPEADYEQSRKIRFEVQDSGIGISEDNRKKLFKSFSQADMSTTREYGGTGLGLAISKLLVRMMGGQIGVYSEEGKGSLFWFTIHAEEAGQAIPKASELKPSEPTIKKSLRILLAEDNIINQKVTLLNIARLGHQAELAANGLEAVKLFASRPFDLVLMDVQMPGIDGLQATREIRKIELKRKSRHAVPIIAMTANLYGEEIRELIDSGMDDYLGKPFKPSDLDQSIRKNYKPFSS